MRGLVLSGGGARGLAHIGVLEVLEAQGFQAEVIAGTSMGAVVGALYASGKKPHEILEIARSTPRLRLLDLVPRPGLISQRGLRDFLAKHLPPGSSCSAKNWSLPPLTSRPANWPTLRRATYRGRCWPRRPILA